MFHISMIPILPILLFYEVINSYGTEINGTLDQNQTDISSQRQIDIDLEQMRLTGSSIVNNIEGFPFIASIYRKHVAGSVHRVSCTGTLVSETKVLTTAKCVLAMPDFHNYMIHMGRPRSNIGGIRRNIVRVTIHPDYDKSKLDAINLHNVALLIMDQPVTEEEGLKFAMFPKENDLIGPRLEYLVENEAKCKAAGFGSFDLHKGDAGVLREVDMKLIPWDVCQSIFKGALEIPAQICVSATESTPKYGYCFNDDGGILMCEGVVYGIYAANAVNKDCAQIPSTFIRLDSLSNFFIPENETREVIDIQMHRMLPDYLANSRTYPICQSLRVATANNPCPSQC